MTARSLIDRIVQQEDINFFLTNRIPRRRLTQLMGCLSRIEQPWLCAAGIFLWRLFSDLDLGEAEEKHFKSLHACFTRRLKDGVRPIDGDAACLTSPCDALVGACGRISEGTVLQAKGFPYGLQDLLIDPALAESYREGTYVTLRLTSSMYHRFHAPYDCSVTKVTYICGDTWNVNPIALKRIAKLFCKNERAVIRAMLRPSDIVVTLVPVAAILVASIRLHFLDALLNMQYHGAAEIPCRVSFVKGQEMGWFQHGSTIIVFAPRGVALCESVQEGAVIRMGRPLMQLPS